MPKEFKYKRVLKGLPAECAFHGVHTDWFLSSPNGAQCKLCQIPRRKKYLANKRINDPISVRLRKIKDRCKSKNIECTLTKQDLENKLKEQRYHCALTGTLFNSFSEVSVDRIDPKKGYTIPNIQLVTYHANAAKWTLTTADFISFCKRVIEFDQAGGLTDLVKSGGGAAHQYKENASSLPHKTSAPAAILNKKEINT